MRHYRKLWQMMKGLLSNQSSARDRTGKLKESTVAGGLAVGAASTVEPSLHVDRGVCCGHCGGSQH